MDNYELWSDNIKEIDWVVSQVRDWLNSLKDKLWSEEESLNSAKEKEVSESGKRESLNNMENNDLFYEISDKKATLKMDIVKKYLEMIKDKEWSDLKSSNSATWIMAVQIALRSTQIWWNNHDKYWEIVIDGILGPNTKEAVKKFQEDNGLESDGLPGKNTLNKIYDILDWKVTIDNSKWTVISNSLESKEQEPEDSKIVSIKDYIKDIQLDIRYATTNNFTWQKIYEDNDAKLRYWTIKKLKVVQDELIKKWYSIKIWDAYRPQSAQEKLRSIRPDPTLVARPEKWSAHTRWNTVDITLVKSDWTEIPMPSEFDDNNKKRVDRNYSDLTEEQRKNAKILEDAMKSAWFAWYDKEWRHYSDTKSYPMEKWD